VARIGGRSSAVAWVVGLGCAAVVGTLAVLAAPALPMGLQLVGDTLRTATSAPEAAGTEPPDLTTTSTPECRALYTEALWSNLTTRAGGDPVQDTAAPPTSVTALTTALTPQVRVSCTFTGTNTGRIATTESEVAAGATAIAGASLEAAGFTCSAFGDGIRCEHVVEGGIEEHTVRDGIWLATVFSGWRPDHYTDRVAQQVWPD
jgi:hypothetical protein